MKVYVVNYLPKKREPEEGRVPGQATTHAVHFSQEPTWTMAFLRQAQDECETLRGMRVPVGQHYCDFSIEKLPEGSGFAIACLSHPSKIEEAAH